MRGCSGNKPCTRTWDLLAPGPARSVRLAALLSAPRHFMFVRLKIIFGPLGPAQRHLHRALCALAVGWMLRTLVERHDDVRAQSDLYFHGALGSEHVRRAVQMGTEIAATFD